MFWYFTKNLYVLLSIITGTLASMFSFLFIMYYLINGSIDGVASEEGFILCLALSFNFLILLSSNVIYFNTKTYDKD